jgi:hypothetical protein
MTYVKKELCGMLLFTQQMLQPTHRVRPGWIRLMHTFRVLKKKVKRCSGEAGFSLPIGRMFIQAHMVKRIIEESVRKSLRRCDVHALESRITFFAGENPTTPIKTDHTLWLKP